MPNLKIIVNVELDGAQAPGFPLTRRIFVDEVQQFEYEKLSQSAGVHQALPADQLESIQALIIQASDVLSVRLDGQSDAGIILNRGGILIILDATIDAGAGSANASVSNINGDPITVKGLAGGT